MSIIRLVEIIGVVVIGLASIITLGYVMYLSFMGEGK